MNREDEREKNQQTLNMWYSTKDTKSCSGSTRKEKKNIRINNG